MNSTLPVKLGDSLTHTTMRQIVNYLLQFGILLPNDLIELRRAHAGVLKLLERTASLDRLVLARIADHQHPVVRPETFEELTGLTSADETRFVDHVKMSVA